MSAEDFSRQVEPTWPCCLRDTMLAVFRRREVRRCLFASPWRHASLALAACRIWAAYATGALRYVIFTAEKQPTTDGMIAGNRGGSARG